MTGRWSRERFRLRADTEVFSESRNGSVFCDQFVLPPNGAIRLTFDEGGVTALGGFGRVLGKQCAEFLFECLGFRIAGQVGEFLGIVAEIVEFFRTVCVANVAVGFGADGIVTGTV